MNQKSNLDPDSLPKLVKLKWAKIFKRLHNEQSALPAVIIYRSEQSQAATRYLHNLCPHNLALFACKAKPADTGLPWLEDVFNKEKVQYFYYRNIKGYRLYVALPPIGQRDFDLVRVTEKAFTFSHISFAASKQQPTP